MAITKYEEPRGKFFNVLGSTGKFHQKVEEGTAGAVLRKYESSDGVTGEKWELIASEITGVIENISIYEGDYGKNIIVSFKLEEGEVETDRIQISLSASSPFGEQFLEKLPNIDTTKEVTFKPYSFEDDAGKPKKGLTIMQNGVKLNSHYNEYNTETKKWKSKKGFPLPEGDTSKYDTDAWKVYFITKRKYLIEELKKNALFVEALEEKTVADIADNF